MLQYVKWHHHTTVGWKAIMNPRIYFKAHAQKCKKKEMFNHKFEGDKLQRADKESCRELPESHSSHIGGCDGVGYFDCMFHYYFLINRRNVVRQIDVFYHWYVYHGKSSCILIHNIVCSHFPMCWISHDVERTFLLYHLLWFCYVYVEVIIQRIWGCNGAIWGNEFVIYSGLIGMYRWIITRVVHSQISIG